MTEPTPEARPGRWLQLVAVEVFGLLCDDDAHEHPKAVGWGLSDAVEAWSDCNRADGHIYRVDDDWSTRKPGETARVWVADADLPFFEKRWGSEYLTGEDVVDMVPPTAVSPIAEATVRAKVAAEIRQHAQDEIRLQSSWLWHRLGEELLEQIADRFAARIAEGKGDET